MGRCGRYFSDWMRLVWKFSYLSTPFMPPFPHKIYCVSNLKHVYLQNHYILPPWLKLENLHPSSQNEIIFPTSFSLNPDTHDPIYSTPLGIYSPHCGLDNIMLSWGHDEYLYHICKDQSTLPLEALAMIRYHSFYPWHSGGAYMEFMDKTGHDERMLEAVRAFNPYDLYSKSDDVPSVEALKVCLCFIYIRCNFELFIFRLYELTMRL